MLRDEVKSEKHSDTSGGSNEGIGTEKQLHGPMDSAKTLKLRLPVGYLGLLERRKRVRQQPGEESGCTDVPVWQRNRE